ncbi:MAG TPA: glycosyltransferase family 39 protein [Candidatus Binatia bacterium]|nr:glycosyltransferase family 39 protein [Candidatus Binatia bacterium]
MAVLSLLGGGGLLAAAALRVWRRPPADGTRAPVDALEAIYLTLVTGLVVLGWLGVALATAGRFSAESVGACCALAAAAIVALGGRRAHVRAPRAGLAELAVVGILVASAVAYARPHEYVLGGADAGTYMNVATGIARTGSLVVRDDWVALAARHDDASLRPSPKHLRTRFIQFVGWYVDDDDPARVLPQFLPLHPALVAVAIAAGGVRAGLYVAPACALLGLAGVFLVARRLFGAATGAVAAAILAATPTQLFFARYPTAEPLTFALVFAGLLAYQHLRDDERRSLAFGVLGGSAFGAAALARIDVPVVLALVAAALVAEAVAASWGRGWTAFAIALALFVAHAAAHGALLAWPYVWNVFEGPVRGAAAALERHPRSLPIAAVAGAALALAAIAAGARAWRVAAARARRDRLARLARTSLAAIVVAASAYAYFVRPAIARRATSTTWPSGLEYPLLDAQNWVRVGWYLTPFGLALATAGLAVVIARGQLARAGLFVAIGAVTTAQYVARILTTPYHIYAMRRFVPIAMPALAIFAAAALTAIARSPRVPRARVVAAVATAALLVAILARSRPALAGRDFAGAIDWLYTLQSRLRPGSVILVAEPGSALFADTFGPPLRYLFDHPVVPIRRGQQPMLDLLKDVFERADAEGRAVQLLAVDPIPFAVRYNVALRPVATVPVALTMLMNTYAGFPTERQLARYGIEVFDVAPGSRPGAADRDVLVDVGTLDTPYLRGGFSYKEVLGDGTTGRWTDGDASLEVPVDAREPVDVAIRARVFDAAAGDPPLVRVLFDDRPVASFRPTSDWQVVRFTALPRPYEGRSRVRLITPTFRPAAGGSPDARELGVFVDWVRVARR